MIKAFTNRKPKSEIEEKARKLAKQKMSQMKKIKKGSVSTLTTMYDDLEIVLSKTFDEDEMMNTSMNMNMNQ